PTQRERYRVTSTSTSDLRRFPGSTEVPGRDFVAAVDTILEGPRPHIEPERFPFLVHDFEGLVQRFGGVVGNKLKRFEPRKLKPQDIPTSHAREPRDTRQLELL